MKTLKPFIFALSVSLLAVLSCKELDNKLPEIQIIAPENNSEFDTESVIAFACEASDAEDGELIENSLVWKSSINGEFGRGQNLSIGNLSVGTHLIIAQASDSKGDTGSDTISIIVFPVNLPPEVKIVAPDNYDEFYESDIVRMICSASDPEDGQIPQESISWTSDKDGFLANGKSVYTDKLSLNLHKIWVDVADVDGATASDTINIRIKKYN